MKTCMCPIAFAVILLSSPAFAEDQTLASLFARHGLNGTMVISSLETGQTFVHNDRRAHERFTVASTFKILNTLIALEEQVISSQNDVLKWDGHVHDFPEWNRDQTLESAFKSSCVWFYQEIARRIGPDKYRDYLKKLEYGILEESFNITTFWLDGSLKASAVEQVDFLRKIYRQTSLFSASTSETLRRIMLQEKTPAFALWAKTGWSVRVKPQTGWYVGYVETKHDVWFFATNIEVRDNDDLPLRKDLTHAALKEKGIIQ